MRLRIADCRLRITICGLLQVLIAALPTMAMAQSKPADTQPTTSTAPATRPAAPNVPITFGRSGQKLRFWMAAPEGIHVEKVVLRAFGRDWTASVQTLPMSAHPGYHAEVEVPAVRVPTVFSVTPVDSPNVELAHVVAYPDRDVEWDKKITLYSCGEPDWFYEWAITVGLPVTRINPGDLATAKLAPADEKGNSLLILGTNTAGKEFSAIAKLANDKKVNILVLDAEWFGDTAGPVSVAPSQMLQELSELAKQKWPQPLKFASHRKPWPGIANRWAWIADENGLPLVERSNINSAAAIKGAWADIAGKGEKFTSTSIPVTLDSIPVKLSYLPWQEQLGRNESADTTFLAMLTAASKSQPRLPFILGLGVDLTIWPAELRATDADRLSRPVAASEKRPVLSAIYLGPIYPSGRGPCFVSLLDLRGATLPTEVQNHLEMAHGSVLILGDDKMLDEWEWLKLDRAKKTINRPGVVWLSDDELPPSKDNQIKLMLKLTELGVPLASPEQQKGAGKK